MCGKTGRLWPKNLSRVLANNEKLTRFTVRVAHDAEPVCKWLRTNGVSVTIAGLAIF